MDLNLVNEYETIDVLVVDEVELLYGNVRLVANNLITCQSSSKSSCEIGNSGGMHAVQTDTLPKIELPKFD